MKKLYSLIIFMVFALTMWAQSPNKLSYQAVIRNENDELVRDQKIGMQISILQTSASGTPVYTETQEPSTNSNGLVSIEIGAGTTSDDFSTIDWSTGPYFIKTETDPEGGTNYSIEGTSQLLSVPYALHANTFDNINETDPVFSNWDKDYDDLTNKPTGTQIGEMLYWDGSKWITVPSGTPGQYLQVSSGGTPLWNGGPALATVHTDSVYNIGSSSFSCAGSISNDGGYNISEKGFCWSTSPNPTIIDNRVTAGAGTNSYYRTLSGFDQSTTYYVRAYAKNDNPAYGEEISFTTDIASVSIGDTSFGGIVAYVYQPGDYGHVYGETHGFVIAENNQHENIQWYNGTYKLTGAEFNDIGYAKENTDSIVTYQGDGNYAAKICYDLVLNGFDDWYLPSIDELEKLYRMRNEIGFTDWGEYWSSTEIDIDSAKSLNIHESSASWGYGTKNNYYYVRAIRYF